ncbi:MAG: rane dipeptidase [Thermomicrobiales bacterium]|nr:rane dipeptidase [Thermomicrobiales bacterium]
MASEVTPLTANVSERAAALHQKAIVIDALTTSLINANQADRMRRGGLTATNHTAAYYTLDFADAVADIVRVRRQIEARPNDFTLVSSVADIESAKTEGKAAIILGLQNARPIADRLEFVDALHALGVRVIQLTYNERNYVADGCTEPSDAGLSQFGRQLVGEFNRQGILIDLSHCGYRTTRETIEASECPVAITHANPLALSPSPRNKPDDILKSLAERGGVLGLCTWTPMSHRGNGRRPLLADLLDMIEYAVDLIGVDHVGVGTDHGEDVYIQADWERKWGPNGLYPNVTGGLGDWYGFNARYVDGLHSAALFPNLTEGLLQRGYADDDVLKIVGGNFLRLFRETWREAS